MICGTFWGGNKGIHCPQFAAILPYHDHTGPAPDSALAGKAIFGSIARYQKGANEGSGYGNLALASSLILGAVWGLWHLPKYLGPGNGGSFALGTVKVLLDAILYAWLYNSTKGSLLLTTLLHASGNTAGVFLPMANTASGSNMGALAIAVALESIAAIAVTSIAGPARLARTEPKQVQKSWPEETEYEHK